MSTIVSADQVRNGRRPRPVSRTTFDIRAIRYTGAPRKAQSQLAVRVCPMRFSITRSTIARMTVAM